MKGNVAKLQRSPLRGVRPAAFFQLCFGFQHFINTLGGHLGCRHQHDNHHQHHNRHHHIGGIGSKYNNVAERSQAACHVRGRHIFYNRGAYPVNHQGQGVHGKCNAGHQERESPLVKELGTHQFQAPLLEFFILVLFRVIGVHHIDSVQVFPGHQVDMVRQLLHPSEPGHHNADNHQHHGQQSCHKACRDGGKSPAFIYDLDNRPHRHNRRFYHNLQSHGHQHLHLRNVIGGPVNQAGNRKRHHFLLSEIRNPVKHFFPNGIAESGGNPGRQIAAQDA